MSIQFSHPIKSVVVSAPLELPSTLSSSERDKLMRLNELLLYRSISFENRWERGYWIPMSRNAWVAEFGVHDYRNIKHLAEFIGMIETNERYSTDQGFAKSVRLASEFRGAHKIEELGRKPRSKQSRTGNLDPVGSWLASRLSDWVIGPGATVSRAQHALAATFFTRGIHNPSRCEFGGRFHSAGTAIPKEVRNHLSLRGEVGRERGHKEHPIPNVFPYIAQNDQSGGVSHIDVKNCQPLLMGVLASRRLANPPTDLEQWMDLCRNGLIYEYVLERVQGCDPYSIVANGRECPIDPSRWTRDHVKKGLLVALFAMSEQAEQNLVWQATRKLFPSLAVHVDGLRRGDHRNIAKALQRLESTIMIDNTCGAIKDYQCDCTIMTVHDCIVCSTTTERVVRGYIEEAFDRQGAVPQLHVQHAC